MHFYNLYAKLLKPHLWSMISIGILSGYVSPSSSTRVFRSTMPMHFSLHMYGPYGMHKCHHSSLNHEAQQVLNLNAGKVSRWISLFSHMHLTSVHACHPHFIRFNLVHSAFISIVISKSYFSSNSSCIKLQYWVWRGMLKISRSNPTWCASKES